MSAELIDSLTSYCFPYDIRLTNEQSASLVRHLELVQETNKCINLTRITSLDDALILHILDSLLAWKVPSAERLLYLGQVLDIPASVFPS